MSTDPMTTETAAMFMQQRDEWQAVAEKATAQAARYAQALEDISAALNGPAPVMRARLVIASLDVAPNEDRDA